MTWRAEAVAVNGALALLAAATLFPLGWMLSVSFMAPGEAASFPPPLLPQRPTLQHYREILSDSGLLRQALEPGHRAERRFIVLAVVRGDQVRVVRAVAAMLHRIAEPIASLLWLIQIEDE